MPFPPMLVLHITAGTLGVPSDLLRSVFRKDSRQHGLAGPTSRKERLFLPGIEREAMLLGVQDVRVSRERRISMVCSSFFGPIVRTGK